MTRVTEVSINFNREEIFITYPDIKRTRWIRNVTRGQDCYQPFPMDEMLGVTESYLRRDREAKGGYDSNAF